MNPTLGLRHDQPEHDTVPRRFPWRLVNIVIGMIVVTAQCISRTNGQGSLTDPSKPVITQTMYVFTWPNGYSEIDIESSINSPIVTNINFNIVGSKLCIDSVDATYCFDIISTVQMKRQVVAALQLFGLADGAGFDVRWPKALPPLNGPVSYIVVPDPVLPAPSASVRQAFDILHAYYNLHRAQLAAAQASASATPSPSPTPTAGPPVIFEKVEYPSPSPNPQ